MSCVVDIYQYNIVRTFGMPIVDHMVKKDVWIGGFYDITAQKTQFQTIDSTKNNVIKFKVGDTDLQISYDFTNVQKGQPPNVSTASLTTKSFDKGPVIKKYADFVASKLPLEYGKLCCSNGANVTEQFRFMKEKGQTDILTVLIVLLIILLTTGVGYLYISKRK